MQCIFCKKKLSLFRSVMGEQFCSEDHEFSYKREQQQIFAERVLGPGSGGDRPLFEDGGPEPPAAAGDAVVLFPDDEIEADESEAPRQPVQLPDGVEAAFVVERPRPRGPENSLPRYLSRIAPEFAEAPGSFPVEFSGSISSPELPLRSPVSVPISGVASVQVLRPPLPPELPVGPALIPHLMLDPAPETATAAQMEQVAEPLENSGKPAVAQALRIPLREIFAPSTGDKAAARPQLLRRRVFSSLAVRPAPAVTGIFFLTPSAPAAYTFALADRSAAQPFAIGVPLPPAPRPAARPSLADSAASPKPCFIPDPYLFWLSRIDCPSPGMLVPGYETTVPALVLRSYRQSAENGAGLAESKKIPMRPNGLPVVDYDSEFRPQCVPSPTAPSVAVLPRPDGRTRGTQTAALPPPRREHRTLVMRALEADPARFYRGPHWCEAAIEPRTPSPEMVGSNVLVAPAPVANPERFSRIAGEADSDRQQAKPTSVASPPPLRILLTPDTTRRLAPAFFESGEQCLPPALACRDDESAGLAAHPEPARAAAVFLPAFPEQAGTTRNRPGYLETYPTAGIWSGLSLAAMEHASSTPEPLEFTSRLFFARTATASLPVVFVSNKTFDIYAATAAAGDTAFMRLRPRPVQPRPASILVLPRRSQRSSFVNWRSPSRPEPRTAWVPLDVPDCGAHSDTGRPTIQAPWKARARRVGTGSEAVLRIGTRRIPVEGAGQPYRSFSNAAADVQPPPAWQVFAKPLLRRRLSLGIGECHLSAPENAA